MNKQRRLDCPLHRHGEGQLVPLFAGQLPKKELLT